MAISQAMYGEVMKIRKRPENKGLAIRIMVPGAKGTMTQGVTGGSQITLLTSNNRDI